MEKSSKKKLKRTRPEKEAVVETSKKAKIETGKIVTKVSEVEVKNKPLKKSKKPKVETSGTIYIQTFDPRKFFVFYICYCNLRVFLTST